MRIVKLILLVIFAFSIIAMVHGIVMVTLYPFGGHEFHAVFAYTTVGRWNVALKVFGQYVLVAWLISFALVFFRYPLRWQCIGKISSYVVFTKWFEICFFPYRS